MTTTQIRKPKATDIVKQARKEFRITYADAIIRNMTDAQWQIASQKRRLTWSFPHRLSLADAVSIYSLIHSYNAFKPVLLKDFLQAFKDDGITVTLCRESSPAIYFHIPDAGELRRRVEQYANEFLNADQIWWTDEKDLGVWWD